MGVVDTCSQGWAVHGLEPSLYLRQTNVISHWAVIGLYRLIGSLAVAIFVDVSYQSDWLVVRSAGKAGGGSKFIFIPIVSTSKHTMGFSFSVGNL